MSRGLIPNTWGGITPRIAKAKMVFVVRRHEIDYLKPAVVGEALRLRTWIADWKAATSVRATEMIRREDNVPVARAQHDLGAGFHRDGAAVSHSEAAKDCLFL